MYAFIGKSNNIPSVRPLTESCKEINAEAWITEQMINHDNEAFEIMHEFALAQYISQKDDLPEVLMEGFGDFLESAVKFFANLLKSVAEFFKKVFTYFSSFFMAFDKFLEKHKDKINDAHKIEVEGYTYTLDKDVPVLDPINKLISEFNSEITHIEDMELSKLRNRIDEYNNGNKVEELRGIIAASPSPLDSDELAPHLHQLFRNGADDKSSMTLEPTDLLEMANGYKKLKESVKKIKKDQLNTERLLGSLKAFFEKGQKTVYSGRDKLHKTNTITQDDKGKRYKDGETTEYKDDNKLVHVLNLYYSFRYTQARDLCNIAVRTATLKTNAYKECLSFYEKCLRKAVLGSGTSVDSD